jgi:putative transcriptional regulator
MTVVVAVTKGLIRWKLNELMARHRITNKALGALIERHETSVSRLRSADTMPRLDGNDLERICKALSDLSGDRITSADLLEHHIDFQS